jgi:hypothetical protein
MVTDLHGGPYVSAGGSLKVFAYPWVELSTNKGYLFSRWCIYLLSFFYPNKLNLGKIDRAYKFDEFDLDELCMRR